MSNLHHRYLNPKRQRGIIHDRTSALSSYIKSGRTHSRQLTAIEAGITAVEQDVLKLLREVAG